MSNRRLILFVSLFHRAFIIIHSLTHILTLQSLQYFENCSLVLKCLGIILWLRRRLYQCLDDLLILVVDFDLNLIPVRVMMVYHWMVLDMLVSHRLLRLLKFWFALASSLCFCRDLAWRALVQNFLFGFVLRPFAHHALRAARFQTTVALSYRPIPTISHRLPSYCHTACVFHQLLLFAFAMTYTYLTLSVPVTLLQSIKAACMLMLGVYLWDWSGTAAFVKH